MAAQQDRRADTVAISRKAFAFATALATLLTAGVSSTLFGLTIDHAKHGERIRQLEEFGPGTGPRFTQEHYRDLVAELTKQREAIAAAQRELQSQVAVLNLAMYEHNKTAHGNGLRERMSRLENVVDELQKEARRHGR